MKKLFCLLLILLIPGCATTKTKFQVGDCVEIAPDLAQRLPAQAQQMLPLINTKVVDKGEEYYVIQVSIPVAAALVEIHAHKFADLEREVNKVECDKTLKSDLLM